MSLIPNESSENKVYHLEKYGNQYAIIIAGGVEQGVVYTEITKNLNLISRVNSESKGIWEKTSPHWTTYLHRQKNNLVCEEKSDFELDMENGLSKIENNYGNTFIIPKEHERAVIKELERILEFDKFLLPSVSSSASSQS